MDEPLDAVQVASPGDIAGAKLMNISVGDAAGLDIGGNGIDDATGTRDGSGDRALVADIRRHRCELVPLRRCWMTHCDADGRAVTNETLDDATSQEAPSP